MNKVFTQLFKIYRNLSQFMYKFRPAPVFYSVCKFQPTCSEYAEEALVKHGIFKGLYKTGKRILRCNPFSQGGYDPMK